MIGLKPRVIPVLLLQDRGLVKTTKFNNPVYIGNPVNAIKVFNEKYVQELVILDIIASKSQTLPNFSFLKQIASEAFFPLAYGGGIISGEIAQQVLRIGFEKIVLNYPILHDPGLIRDISSKIGSQSIVVCINIIKTFSGGYHLYNHVSGKSTRKNIIEYVRQIEELGAGELIVQSVHLDGTMGGYDLKLIQMISLAVSIPVIALGGAGKNDDFTLAVQAGASAVAAGSMFVFHGKHKAVLISYPSRDELKEQFYQKIV